ncbi:MAG: ATP-binding protein [Desulfofustis sp.]|nr:ATP-binding protein [Desulfofustis sp.]NNK13950.1 ATP-binding protein [Desulfofustis sp.]
MSEMLGEISERWNIPGKTILQINLVLDELFTNVVSYGLEEDSSQQVHFSLSYHGNELSIVVSDDGRSFDPTQAPKPELDLPIDDQPVGGLGIFLMRQYTDNIEYRRENEKNIVTLTKKI